MTSLNPCQLEAVHTTEGPVLIIAGAGSGKTRVLTERIKYLITEKHVPSENILAVTFTNKAAREMKSRLPQGYHYPWIGTFHGICHKLLRIEWPEPFVIYDSKDQMELIKILCERADLDEKTKPYSVLEAISHAKNEMLTPETFAAEAQSPRDYKIAQIFAAYQTALSQHHAMDFDDLLNMAVRLLQREPALLEKYRRKFQYISVDEYQDTNRVQYLLTKILAETHHNLCVVGDADQNIYSWRGANIRNILNFEHDFPNVKVILLEQNYRSTQTILDIANSVIEKNENRKKKSLWTENEKGPPARFWIADDETDEARFIAEEIQAYDKLSETVVLYRTNAQSRILEEIFMQKGIPYRMVGGMKFYERKEVKDILAYVRVLYNPADQIAENRIKKLPALKKFMEVKSAIDITQVPHLLIEAILKITKYRDKLELKATEEAISRVENINELVGVAQTYESLPEFLAHAALVADIDLLDDGTHHAVTLMTLHSAKGLEFPLVIIGGCEEGLLPHYRSQYNPDSLEEERRLFYVGITRAQSQLVFTAAKKRFIFGETWYNEISRFMQDVPEGLVEAAG
jgi:DNA helicase-2/ATP-dependent DNA helicase PcrA